MVILMIIGLVFGVPSFIMGVSLIVNKLRNRRQERWAAAIVDRVDDRLVSRIEEAVEPLRRELLPNGGSSLTDRVARIDRVVGSHDGRFTSIDQRLNSVDGRLNTIDQRLDEVKIAK
jgi:hypothetical protein